MKIFNIAIASFLAVVSVNSFVNPSYAKHKSSSYKPLTSQAEVSKSKYSNDKLEYIEDYSNDDSNPSSNRYQDYSSKKDQSFGGKYKAKKGKYKVDKYDHHNHTDKSMCVETELDQWGGKTGWHSDKNDPTHYDDKDDQEHCGYYFPHELENSHVKEDNQSEENCNKQTKNKWKNSGKVHKGHKH